MISASSTPPTGLNSSRLGLRVLIGFVILYMAIFVVNLSVGVGPNLLMKWLEVSPNVRTFVGSTFSYAVRIAAVCILPALALKKVLGMDPRSTFFPFRNGWWKDLLFGFLLVAVILYGLFFFEVRAGWLVVEGWNWRVLPFDVFVRTAWVGLLVNVSVAIGEETVFRGYLLKGLKTAWGQRVGIVVMMIIFGSFHLPAYIEGGLYSGTLTLAILLATLFGGLFGFAYLRTQSLWLPISLHFAWNFVENDLLNLSADRTNVNLIGALTRLHSPLSMTELQPGNVILVEMLMFAIIALGVWLWLKLGRIENTNLST